MKLPIFVARQWIRHRTANVNEYSARYSILDNEFYVPAPEHLAAQCEQQPPGPRARRSTARRGGRASSTLLREMPSAPMPDISQLLNEDEDGRARSIPARRASRASSPG